MKKIQKPSLLNNFPPQSPAVLSDAGKDLSGSNNRPSSAVSAGGGGDDSSSAGAKDEDDLDEEDDDEKVLEAGGDPEKLKAFNVSSMPILNLY